MRRDWTKAVLVAALLFGAAVGAVLAWHRFPALSSPTYGLRVAVGPSAASESEKFLAAFVRAVAEEYPFVRFRLVTTDTWDAAGKALLEGSADLAVVRSDDPAAGQGQTLVILRKLTAAFLADSKAKLENARMLSGKKIGVLEGDRDDRLVAAIIAFYGFPSGNIVIVPAADAGKAIREKRVAALLALGPLGPGALADAATAIRKATKNEPAFLDIEEAETFAKQYPVYETMEIPKGAFGGASLQPADTVDTVAVALRLVSRASLHNRTAGEITRIILATKAKLAASMPAVGQIEAPDPDEVNVLPIHPGTVTYLKGEQQSLWALANDNLFTIVILGGAAASVGGSMLGLSRSRRRTQQALLRLAELRRQAGAGAVPPAELERELDEIAAVLFERMAAQSIEPERFLAASTIIDQIRRESRVPHPRAHEFGATETGAAR
jgi:TRAP-type uncharacterized transport system substrate-binding protein